MRGGDVARDDGAFGAGGGGEAGGNGGESLGLGQAGEVIQVARSRAEDVKEGVSPAALGGDVLVKNLGAPGGVHGGLVLGAAEAVLGSVLVEGDDLGFAGVGALDLGRGAEHAAAQPSGDLGQHGEVFLLVPLDDLLSGVGLVLVERDVDGYQDAALSFGVSALLGRLEGGCFLGPDEIVEEAVDFHLADGLGFAGGPVGAQLEVGGRLEVGHVGHVVGGQEVRLLAVGGLVAQAVGEDLRETQTGRAVLVVVPLVKLVEREALLGLHRHVEHAFSVLCGRHCC